MGKLLNAILAVSILIVPLHGQTPNPAQAQKAPPSIQLVDNKLSIQAEAVPLGRLVKLLDLATGMTSTVSSDVANRNVYVRFSDLELNAGIRKIFEGQSLDYVVLSGKGIQVRGVSEALPATTSAPAAATTFTQTPIQDLPFNNGPPVPQPPPNPTTGVPQGNQLPGAVPVVPAAVRPANAPQPNVPVTPPGAIPMYTPPAPAPGPTGGTGGAGAAPAPAPPLGNGALPVFNPTGR